MNISHFLQGAYIKNINNKHVALIFGVFLNIGPRVEASKEPS